MTDDLILKLIQAAPGVALAIALIMKGPALLTGIRDLVQTVNDGAERRDAQLTSALASMERTSADSNRQINEIMARYAGGDYRLDVLSDRVAKLENTLEDVQAQLIKLTGAPKP